mmetsp:Transcript_24140/g.81493  ORF Transcript_24140/g.81493 Transcript_24140/m.81493 type:complete len:259 (-) Transcript_24140:67-843(-)
MRLAEEDLRDKVAKLDAACRCGGRDVRVPRWRGRGEAALEPWYSRAACSRSKRPLTLGSLDGADSPTKALTWRALWPGKRWLTLMRLQASGGSPAAGAMEAADGSSERCASESCRSTATARRSARACRCPSSSGTAAMRPCRLPLPSTAARVARPSSSRTASRHAAGKVLAVSAAISSAPSAVVPAWYSTVGGSGPSAACRSPASSSSGAAKSAPASGRSSAASSSSTLRPPRCDDGLTIGGAVMTYASAEEAQASAM